MEHSNLLSCYQAGHLIMNWRVHSSFFANEIRELKFFLTDASSLVYAGAFADYPRGYGRRVSNGARRKCLHDDHAWHCLPS